MEYVWNILNSPAVITAFASLVVFSLNKLYAKKPTWAKYEGTIVSAIKAAEKIVPDDSENKSVRRLDTALKYVITVFERREGRMPSTEEEHELVEGINLKHSQVSA